MPSATLVAMGNGQYAGRVTGHPCAGTTVHITSLSHDTRKVRLFHHGECVGGGILRRADGRWTGVCSEYGGTWNLEAQEGSSMLVFHEIAEAGAA